MRFWCSIFGLLLLLGVRVSAAAAVSGMPGVPGMRSAAGFVPPAMVLADRVDKLNADTLGADYFAVRAKDRKSHV